jgi:hypothetical protein
VYGEGEEFDCLDINIMVYSPQHSHMVAAVASVASVALGSVYLVQGAAVGRARAVTVDNDAAARSALNDLGDGLGRLARADMVGAVVADDGLVATQAQAFLDGPQQTASGAVLARDAHKHFFVVLLVDDREGFALLAEDVVGDVAGVRQAAVAKRAALAVGLERIDAERALVGVGFELGEDEGFVFEEVTHAGVRDRFVVTDVDERHGG